MRLPDDVVYLPDETQLQEYIMNEEGIIYMGTWEYIKSIHWNYGQVTHKHLKCDWAEYICVSPVGAGVNCHSSVAETLRLWLDQKICQLSGGNIWMRCVRM